MPVSRGRALVCSAALHTLGIGVAGWITYGQYRGPAASLDLHTTRAHAFHFLTLTRPKPRPEPQPQRRAEPPRSEKPKEDLVPGPRAPDPGPALVPHRLEPSTQPGPSTLEVRELAPGATVGVVGAASVPMPPTAAAPPAARGVDRAAALVVPAGSACPELPLPVAWARRDVAVAVALEVDDRGVVDRSKLRVVQSPGREATGRRYYPRIYVVGAKAERSAEGVDPTAYDSVLTQAVAGHVADLQFTPAMRDGRPVGSTVLIACHWSAGG